MHTTQARVLRLSQGLPPVFVGECDGVQGGWRTVVEVADSTGIFATQ